MKTNNVKTTRERKNWHVIRTHLSRRVKSLLFVIFSNSFDTVGIEVFVERTVFKNNMSIDIRENSIIAGDKNGSDFSIASIALFADMVTFITVDELSTILSRLNRKLD